MNIKKLQDELISKVNDEYQKGFNHIRNERERKRDILKKVLDPIMPEGQVRVNLLWKNIQLELALFLTDEISIKYLSSEGVLGEEIMENANLMAKYDDMDMCLREQRETIINHNALYGLSATVIDSWDDDEKQPIGDVLDPLSIIIDPQNYSGSKMRFFGVERRVTKDWLQTTNGFESIKNITFSVSSELDKTQRTNNDANNLLTIYEDDGMCDIYDHFTIYDGNKRLTTWANDRSILIRAVILEPLTESEKKKPTKVKWGIQLHRRKPKYGCVFGVSIADEILMFQDPISVLTNLQLLQARIMALGPDIFVDDKLGIDTTLLSTKLPGGRIIPITNNERIPTQNGFFVNQEPAPSPFIDTMIKNLESRAEGTTNINQQAFGTSQTGTQTKAEIQTLQQNINQILIWIANNYLEGQKAYWEAHYRSYCLNFSKGRKNISLFQKGKSLSLNLQKDDFIVDGKVNVFITSKSQDALENDKEFNKLLALSELYLSNMKPGYSMNDFLRLLGRKTNIRDFDEYRYIVKSVDELNAMNNLSLLNKNLEVPGPQDGEDYMTYLLVYRQALDTPMKEKIIAQYEEAYTTIQKPLELTQEAGQSNGTTSQMAMNNLNQTTSNTPSTSLIK